LRKSTAARFSPRADISVGRRQLTSLSRDLRFRSLAPLMFPAFLHMELDAHIPPRSRQAWRKACHW